MAGPEAAARGSADRYTVRPFAAADWPHVWAIIEPIVRAGETYPQPTDMAEDAARKWWIDDHRAVFVAEADAGLLGTYYLMDNKPGLGAHVANAGYMVAPHAHGQGVGRALAAHSLHAARKLGYLAMQYNLVVSTNTSSLHLWDSMGFERSGVLPRAFRHSRHGLVDAFVMYKWLGD